MQRDPREASDADLMQARILQIMDDEINRREVEVQALFNEGIEQVKQMRALREHVATKLGLRAP